MRELLQNAIACLCKAGVDSPQYDARVLLAHACGISLADLNKALILGDFKDFLPDYASKYSDFISRRASREPLQHIIGCATFRYIDLIVGKGVFVPRAETEVVVQEGIDWIRANNLKNPIVLDLCAGSGAIGLSVASEVANAQVWAVEKSHEAFEYLQKNYRKIAEKYDISNRYHAILGDATNANLPEISAIKGLVDVVITNPPYVPESKPVEQIEARDYDPKMALYGGSKDGLLIPQKIVKASFAYLRMGGIMIMEHDITQGKALADYAKNIGFSSAKVKNDLTNRARFVVCKKGAKNE
ncbi:protein-(glutamine-N5) methyltransferase [Gardnerella pickettii JCP7659]|uniref:peptide chain release factor N(5)-glutamine methyltransferase n=1 Tax=Gardnerella TaxID=2701 RepID=UPI0003544B3D|nr:MULTISPECIES: peptide chain release factor N(5)-glutamine methyltransferase [Gardnerella]MDK7188927.1 peptide chain release factor N(5)-glutamine methyltransferase [Bifidobacterium sp. UMB1230]MDK7784922.1 peptide chain release factor N(5)-glutamine methyltransferase [Bifidobacterium sp. UMB6791B]MDK8249111.1 peptide chain release factor N(5)-glutamine methyltransferase [Bifidobacterium sp. UMB6794B]MDK8635577.1 peptide chain release factor N(5)-glutamine methyltransferase [Bifidobacterium s